MASHPKHIPGYYWDADKKRYFKGKPPAPPPAPLVSSTIPPPHSITFPPSISSLLFRREQIPSSFLRHRFTFPFHRLKRHPLAFTVPFNGDIRPSPFQDEQTSLRVALASEHGASIASLFWAKGNSELRGTFMHIATVAISAVRWHPRVKNLIAATSFGAENEPASTVIQRFGGGGGQEMAVTERKGSIWTFEWAPTGEIYSIGRTAGGAIWSLSGGRQIDTLWTNKSDLFALAYDPSGRIIIHGDRSGRVRTRDLRAAPAEMRNGSHMPIISLRSSCAALQVLRDPAYLLSSALKDELALWDNRMQKIVTLYTGHVTGLTRLGFSIDDKERHLASFGADSALRIWDLRGGQPIFENKFEGRKIGKRPQWIEHWDSPALLAADGELCYWRVE